MLARVQASLSRDLQKIATSFSAHHSYHARTRKQNVAFRSAVKQGSGGLRSALDCRHVNRIPKPQPPKPNKNVTLVTGLYQT